MTDKCPAPSHASLVWFRRDLRCFDHAALYAALKQSQTVFCVFIFDKTILDHLPEHDRRVQFIHQSIVELAHELEKLGGSLIVRYGHAEQEIPRLAAQLQVDTVFVNHDYEPQAVLRDDAIRHHLGQLNCHFLSFKDQVIFEKDEVLTLSNTPFSIFTPYKNAWLKKFLAEGSDFYATPYPIERYAKHLSAHTDRQIPDVQQMGFTTSEHSALPLQGGMSAGNELFKDFLSRIHHYEVARNFPAIKGPSYLSVHLRFGTVSIRHLVREAINCTRTSASMQGAQIWLSELIWRDFYFMILHHHPRVVGHSFKPDYDAIQWESGTSAETSFAAWCQGRTGYPLVDAAMLQLNQTGYMHNRLRMVTACFLIKDLGIDWRWGERYFALHLNDFDLSANNGGWQWAASTGCDAQPYFRIFNPVTQSEKFDPDGKFIRRYLPQLSRLDNKQIHAPWKLSSTILKQAEISLGHNYPAPIVDHDTARKRTLERYAVVKKPSKKMAP
ncbi:MAG: deoxyribodipyrimidine photo-lyase [Undibacterium sp.]|uniref:cryptochrome/photolyase family protein n=1 Tax=Undibacterium sp. TaxID=1914977 RepID=UPI00271F92DC|nr:deoxyribodipyrimidine photo-lyase [Undibacterium sp.]MDO8652884.1 deoxyribodipyrimidine photo-lyase [Undibacterium sp.]